jgi:hypothetical protein
MEFFIVYSSYALFFFLFVVAKPRERERERETSKRHFRNYTTLVPTFHATIALLVDFVFWVDVRSDDVDNRGVNVRAIHPPIKRYQKRSHSSRHFPFLALHPPPRKPCVSCKICSFQLTNIGSHHNTYIIIIIISLFNEPRPPPPLHSHFPRIIVVVIHKWL